MSRDHLFQDHVIERLVGHQLLQLRVFLLERLQALRLVETHPAVLLPPAVVRLLTDPQLLADLGRAQTAAYLHLGLASCGDDLLGAVPLAWHPASWSLRPNSNARAGTVSGGKVRLRGAVCDERAPGPSPEPAVDTGATVRRAAERLQFPGDALGI